MFWNMLPKLTLHTKPVHCYCDDFALTFACFQFFSKHSVKLLESPCLTQDIMTSAFKKTIKNFALLYRREQQGCHPSGLESLCSWCELNQHFAAFQSSNTNTF